MIIFILLILTILIIGVKIGKSLESKYSRNLFRSLVDKSVECRKLKEINQSLEERIEILISKKEL